MKSTAPASPSLVAPVAHPASRAPSASRWPGAGRWRRVGGRERQPVVSPLPLMPAPQAGHQELTLSTAYSQGFQWAELLGRVSSEAQAV